MTPRQIPANLDAVRQQAMPQRLRKGRNPFGDTEDERAQRPWDPTRAQLRSDAATPLVGDLSRQGRAYRPPQVADGHLGPGSCLLPQINTYPPPLQRRAKSSVWRIVLLNTSRVLCSCDSLDHEVLTLGHGPARECLQGLWRSTCAWNDSDGNLRQTSRGCRTSCGTL